MFEWMFHFAVERTLKALFDILCSFVLHSCTANNSTSDDHSVCPVIGGHRVSPD